MKPIDDTASASPTPSAAPASASLARMALVEPPISPSTPSSPASLAVLMPVYNSLDDAWRTIQSFDEPDLPTVRILVVDDGSQPAFDPTTPPAPLHPCIQLEVLRLDVNGGIERALAAGVAALLDTVRYIARIDAGDLALPGRLAKQQRYLDTHPTVGAVGMWAQAVTRAGEPVFVLAPPSEPAAIRRLRFARSCFVHPAMMLRCDAIRRAGTYTAQYPAAEDLDLFLRIMQHDDCANLPEIGILYELNEGGISATRRRKQVRSTLRLQYRYFNAVNPYDWIGLAKNVLHLTMPYTLLHRIKRLCFQRTP